MNVNRILVHDFPTLARESGFQFWFRSKKVDWGEIAKIDINDIVTNQKFELVEENIDLVVNCDLLDEANKVLDQDLVKLFKLAQMSVGYLRHCQIYLDKCIMLLQEQLSSALKATEKYKDTKNQDIYQCKACDKKFLSSVYLGSHERRRHTNECNEPLTVSIGVQTNHPGDDDKQKTTSFGQQTDHIVMMPTAVQTDEVKCVNASTMTDFDDFVHNQEQINVENQLKLIYDRVQAVEVLAKKDKDLEPPEKTMTMDMDLIVAKILPLLPQHVSPTLRVNTDTGGKEFVDAAVSPIEESPLIDLSSPHRTPSYGENVLAREPSQIKFPDPLSIEDVNSDESQNLVDSPVQVHYSQSAVAKHRIRKKVLRTFETPDVAKVDVETLSKPIPKPRQMVSVESKIREVPAVTVAEMDAVQDFVASASDSSGVSNIEDDEIRSNNEQEVFNLKVSGLSNSSPTIDHTTPKTSSPIRTRNMRLKPRKYLQKLIRSSPNMSNFKESLRRSWSNLYDASKSSDEMKSRSDERRVINNNLKRELNDGGKEVLENEMDTKKSSDDNVVKDFVYDSSSPSSGNFESNQDIQEKSTPFGGSGTSKFIGEMYDNPQKVETRLTATKGMFHKFIESSPRMQNFVELTGIFEEKLRSVGVDPDWSEIPDKSFNRAMSALTHGFAQKAKVNANYLRVREEIEVAVDRQLEEMKKASPMLSSGDQLNVPDFTLEPLMSSPLLGPKSAMYNLDSDSESDYSATVLPTTSTPVIKPSLDLPSKNGNDNNRMEKDEPKSKPNVLIAPAIESVLEKGEKTETDFSMFEVDRKSDIDSSREIDFNEQTDLTAASKKSSISVKNKAVTGAGMSDSKKKVAFAVDDLVLESSDDDGDDGRVSSKRGEDIISGDVPDSPQEEKSSTSSSDWDIPL